MPDTYLQLVNSGPTATLAKRLGLPRPAVLRRYTPGAPLVDGPVLVLGRGDDADALARLLSGPAGGMAPGTGTGSGTAETPVLLDGWDLEVHRHPAPDVRYGAVVLVLTAAERPDQLTDPVLAAAGPVKGLRSGGRVVTVSRTATADDAPAVAAARQGVDGLLRSLAKELRGGSTGNGVVLTGDVPVTAPSAVAALRFFLSRRSARCRPTGNGRWTGAWPW